MKQRLSPEEMFPAGETGYRVRHLQLHDGTRVRVVERGDMNAPPIMLLHGWGCSAFAFYRNMPGLAGQGTRVIAPDLKGHGLSDKDEKAPGYSTEHMVEHVLAIADALNLKRFAIAGHSMGAALALCVAIAKSERISALGLLSPVGTSGLLWHSAVRTITPEWSLPIWRALNTRWMTKVFLRVAYGKFGSPTEVEVDEYWAPSQFPAFTAALRHLLHSFNWGPFFIGGLDAYNIPILVMSGSRDHLCRRRTREHLRTSLRCEPRVIQGAGHLLLSEIPDEVNSALLGLLASQR